MLPFHRSWLARPSLFLLGCGWLLGSGACGGVATGELGGELNGDGGASGGTGGSGGTGNLGGSGGRGTGGGDSGGGSGGFGGVAGFSGSAGSFGSGGTGAVGGGGVGGSVGAAGTAGTAGSTGAGQPSICVNFDAGLAGLPSHAFPAGDGMVRDFCGPSVADQNYVFQAVCLPAPGNGQSCNFYDSVIGLAYECGQQSSASFVCGPHQPPAGTDGCRGNECCYVLVGDCPLP